MKNKGKLQKTPLATANRDEGQAMNWQRIGTELKQRKCFELQRKATNRKTNWHQIETRLHKANLLAKNCKRRDPNKGSDELHCIKKKIAKSTYKFRRIEPKKDKGEIRDDQCGCRNITRKLKAGQRTEKRQR
jgi:hypothetical protein